MATRIPAAAVLWIVALYAAAAGIITATPWLALCGLAVTQFTAFALFRLKVQECILEAYAAGKSWALHNSNG